MPTKRIRPKPIMKLRIAHRNMARETFGEALARENPEGACHVRQQPCAVRAE
jgi:hypothetical protein